jgi:YidC/Oxa1 family membrane protein insertase
MKMIAPKGAAVDPTQKSMSTIMPIMFAWITLKVPAGLALYWVVGNLFTIVQQYFMITLPASKEVKNK